MSYDIGSHLLCFGFVTRFSHLDSNTTKLDGIQRLAQFNDPHQPFLHSMHDFFRKRQNGNSFSSIDRMEPHTWDARQLFISSRQVGLAALIVSIVRYSLTSKSLACSSHINIISIQCLTHCISFGLHSTDINTYCCNLFCVSRNCSVQISSNVVCARQSTGHTLSHIVALWATTRLCWRLEINHFWLQSELWTLKINISTWKISFYKICARRNA